MVGGRENFSEPQGPEDLQNRSQRAQEPSIGTGSTDRCQPMGDVGEGLAQETTIGLGGVQTVGPAAERGGIGQAIRVLERGRRLLPGAVLLKTPPQRLGASQQAIVGVRERKRRQEGESLLATGTTTTTDPDPVVVLIVRLFAATPVADDRIAFTNRAPSQDDPVAVFGPVGFQLVRWGGKWDKKNRSSAGLYSGIDLAKDLSRSGAPPPEKKIPTGRE